MLETGGAHLKKVLALVLAFACAFTMFASAAFTDQSDIAVDSDVVDTMTALGVIEGYLDGSFRPDDTVTRGEMAKMIYVVRTGRSDASAYNDDATTFTDIGDHWARGYIKYCNSLGIIAGHSATRFAPDDTVTTQEAAKMLLVTLGYNAETAGLVGAGWGTKTNALADENGLLEDVVNGTTQALPRQYAAQLIYNAIFTPTVVLRDGEYTNLNYITGAFLPTIGERYMGLKSVEGKLKDYTDGKANFEDIDWGENKEVSFADYTADHSDLVGREVRILYKESTNANTKATIYGIFEIGDNTYIDTIVGDVDMSDDKKEIDINDTTYDVAENPDKTVTNWTDKKSAQPVTVTLNDDGDVYKLESDSNFLVAQIRYTGSSSVRVDKSYDLDDEVELYDGYAKDDWVVKSLNDYTNKTVFTKADTVTGEVEVVNDADITIDGQVYTIADDNSQSGIANVLTLGNTVEIVVVDGYIYNAEKVSGVASLEDLVAINGMEKQTSYGKPAYMAQATFGDNTSAEIEIKDILGNDAWDQLSDTTAHKNDGLYAFDLDDGKYTLRKINSNGYDDYDAAVAENDITSKGIDDGRIGGARINDEAVIFINDSDNDLHVLTGAAVKGWDKSDVTITKGEAYGNQTSGYTYVEVAYVEISEDDVPGASYNDVYGYVVKRLGESKVDGTTYTSFSVWTGSENETVSVKGSSSNFTDIKAGSFVKVDGDDINLLVAGTDYAYTGAVAGTDGESFTIYNSLDADAVAGTTEYNITSDTKVIYVDTDAKAGEEGGALDEANEPDEGEQYIPNVFFVTEKSANDDGSYDLVALFVDVNNELNIVK